MFSLTNGHKLKLVSEGCAIFYEDNNDYALRFGAGSDLRIANFANKNEQSYCAIPTSYHHEAYKSNDPDLHEKFTGSKSIYFGIKEWEVWQVIT